MIRGRSFATREARGADRQPPPPEWAVGLLFAFVVVAWSLSWVTMKIVVSEASPLWAVAARTWIAAIVLLPVLVLTGELRLPPRGDWPVIAVIALFHMVAFAALMTAGLRHVPAGRAIVLGYTTPLWVAPAARVFLKEALPARRLFGIALAMVGVLILFDPGAFDWHDGAALLGNALILGAAMCWSVSILYTRAHRWTMSPFQLVVWQALLAAVVLTALAALTEGRPITTLSGRATAALAYNGVVGTALGYWAMTVVNKTLPATTTSLGVLGTPVVGLILSTLLLGEPLDIRLILASATIAIGIAVGVRPKRRELDDPTAKIGN